MLKKLLYLYNDGHNPFPHTGKGGLGYHLPNRKLVGGSFHKIEGQYYYYDDDKPDEYFSNGVQKEFNPSLVEFGPNGLLFRGKPVNELHEYPTYTKTDIEYNPYEPGEELPHAKKEREQQEEVQRVKTALDDFKNPDTGLITEIQGKDYDRMTTEHKLSLLYSLVEYTNTKDFKTVGAHDFFKQKLDELLAENNMTIRELENANIDDDIEAVKEDLTEINQNNKKIKDPNITQPEINELLKKQIPLLLKHRDSLIDKATDDVRQIMIKKGNSNPTKQDLSGKGFEHFLCTTGDVLVNKSVGQLGEVNNFDDHTLIPASKQKYGVVDLYVDNGIIECKDYRNENMNDVKPIAIQESKLSGNISFEIYFEKKGKDNYVVSNILCEGKPLLNPTQELNKYILLVNASDGIYKYDFLKDKDFVNDKNMELDSTGQVYQFKRKTIPLTMDYVSGGKTQVKSLRIDKSKFKKIK